MEQTLLPVQEPDNGPRVQTLGLLSRSQPSVVLPIRDVFTPVDISAVEELIAAPACLRSSQ